MKRFLSNIFSLFIALTTLFVVSGFFLPITILADHNPDHAIIEIRDGNPAPTEITDGNPAISASLVNPFKGGDSLFALLQTVINEIVLPIGGVLAVLAFIYSGFLYVTAQGNETKLKDAHKALLYTSIGTAVLLGSWVLANVICETIGQLGGPACAT